MGASVTAYWPGITEQQIDAQPGFFNDDKAWGNWMAEREEEPAVSAAIRDAVARLRAAIQSGAPEARPILASYERNANRVDPIAEEFLRDVEDIEALTRWAEAQGATRIHSAL